MWMKIIGDGEGTLEVWKMARFKTTASVDGNVEIEEKVEKMARYHASTVGPKNNFPEARPKFNF